MSSAEALQLRPGVALGRNPERDTRADGGGVAALEAWRRSRTRRRLAREAPRAVAELRARIEEISRESDAAIDAGVEACRERLLIDGPSQAHTLRAIALVAELAGRCLGQRAYDVQLMGAWLMTRGALVEMETGEGKTLATALAATSVAMAGIPVHVMSANDYLVARDAESTGPLHARLGIEVGVALESVPEPERRLAYRADITYATGKQIAFDYLRDRMECLRAGLASAPEPRLRGLCFALVDEADSVLIDEARTPLVLSRPAPAGDMQRVAKRALRLAMGLQPGTDFSLDPRRQRARLTESGRSRLAERSAHLGSLWQGSRRREEWIERALGALHLYERDRDYLVRDDRVEIIDSLSGRTTPDRSWGRWLHQMIELKEGCPPTPPSETLASISYQQFFRRYLRLAGTTGTAREVAGELGRVYGLSCVRVPTRRPSRRVDLGARLAKSQDEKWHLVAERTRALHEGGRAVLIGTASVSASERLSAVLAELGLPHQVLNARQDAEEALIVARAGRSGAITVATSMAGRGTDISLAEEVAARGGLHVIATEPAESSRVDRQLFGRCARQGDPGSFEMIASFEDPPLIAYFPLWVLHPLAAHRQLTRITGNLLTRALLRLPQRAEEKRHERVRRALSKAEDERATLLSFSGIAE